VRYLDAALLVQATRRADQVAQLEVVDLLELQHAHVVLLIRRRWPVGVRMPACGGAVEDFGQRAVLRNSRVEPLQ
jgi:hypothetical protein